VPKPRTLKLAALGLSGVTLLAPVVAVGAALGVVGAALSAGPALAAGQACTGTVAGVSAYGGAGQVAKVGESFSSPLEAEVVDTGGCPVANADVIFIAPTSGASGVFPGGDTTVTIATGTNGVASAPTFTANSVSGSYSVTATVDSGSSQYTATFQLTNTTVGAVSALNVSSGNDQSAHIGSSFASPLAVSVVDAYGDPVTGTPVAFTVVTDDGAGASFAGGGSTATVDTNASGIATSPALTAGSTVGPFTVTASVSGSNGNTSMVTFSLTDLAGTPDAIAAGVGTSQSAELGTDFPVPLAVTVTDADGNDVAGVSVVFSAPTSGPSGVFADAGDKASVLTNSDGVATAPDFSANEVTGGYVVTAEVGGVSTLATFALVNSPRSGANVPGPSGAYWLVTSKGQVFASGSAKSYGSLPAKEQSSPVVGMAATADGRGYWLATANGKVYSFGDAVNYGSPAASHLAADIVGIAATPDGKGYWLAAADGGVFNYGDAKFYGSAAKAHLAAKVTGIAATPDGKGYWLAASDGGIFNYGDATFAGSAANLHLANPIVGVAAAPTGKGYWLLSSGGAVYAYGSATHFGRIQGLVPSPARALVRTSDGFGYWVVSANGTAAGFGDAGGQGSPTVAAKTVVAGAGAA